MQRPDSGRASGQHDTGGCFHPKHQVRAVAPPEPVRDVGRAAARNGHGAVRRLEVGSVAHEDDEVGRATEAAHHVAMRGPESARGDRGERRMMGSALDPEAVPVVVAADELIAHCGLRDSRRGVDVGTVLAGDGRGRMQPQELADAASAEPRALQDHRCADCTGGQDHHRGLGHQVADGAAR